jgi:hypothetical protein
MSKGITYEREGTTGIQDVLTWNWQKEFWPQNIEYQSFFKRRSE